jgi:hypothetical protein
LVVSSADERAARFSLAAPPANRTFEAFRRGSIEGKPEYVAGMSVIIFLIVVLVVLALALYLVDLLPIPSSTIKRIIQALLVLVALLVILNRTGLITY